MKLIKRQIFDQIEPYIGDNTVIVLHGARQVGKTHILFYIQNWLEDKHKKVFYYDLEYPNLLRDLNLGVDVFTADWGAILTTAVNAGVAAFVGYMAKNFVTDDGGQVFGSI